MVRIVVLGGTGQIGAKTVARLRSLGHDVRAASRRTGVDALTGAGLDDALDGAEIVIDTSKPSAGDDAAVQEFFRTATTNLLRAERAHDVGHHVALSIVGSHRPHDIPFYQGKAAAEQIVRESGVPFSILHATQFFEFAPAIAAACEVEGVVLTPDALVQPAAGSDVAQALIEVALAAPTGADTEVAGLERMPLAGFIAKVLRAGGDRRAVRASTEGRYFGGTLERDTLLPGEDAQILPTTLYSWLRAATPSASAATLEA